MGSTENRGTVEVGLFGSRSRGPTGWIDGGKDLKREKWETRRGKESIYKRVEININLCGGEGEEGRGKGRRGEDS